MIHVDDGCVDAVSSDHDELMVDSLQFPYYTLRIISLQITIEDQHMISIMTEEDKNGKGNRDFAG